MSRTASDIRQTSMLAENACPLKVAKMIENQSESAQTLSNELRTEVQRLEQHPIFNSVQSVPQLRAFMEHHVFPVWDFMSLLKFLQSELAPSKWPWQPSPYGDLVRLINDIVLAEESDALPEWCKNGAAHVSHFELYLLAMREVGADTGPVCQFLKQVSAKGLNEALSTSLIPEPSRLFMDDTFNLLAKGKPHEVAAAFSFGRENAIPGMFNALLSKLGIHEEQAPLFHYYLKRHAELDGDDHGPAAIKLVTTLCGNDPIKLSEAVSSARKALESRYRFWDQVRNQL